MVKKNEDKNVYIKAPSGGVVPVIPGFKPNQPLPGLDLLDFDSTDPYKKYLGGDEEISKAFTMQDFMGKKKYLAESRKKMGEEAYAALMAEDDITRYANKQKGHMYDMFKATGAGFDEYLEFIYSPETFFERNPMSEMSNDQLIAFNNAQSAMEDLESDYRVRWDPNAEINQIEKENENVYGEVEPTWSDLWDATTGTIYDVWRDQYNLGSIGLGGLLETSPLSILGLQDYLYDNMYKDEFGERMFEDESDDWWTTSMAKELGNFLFTPSSVDEDNPYYDRAQRFRWGLDAVPTLLQTYLTRGKGLPAAITSRLPAKGQSIMHQFLPYLSGKGTFWPPRKTGAKWYQRDLIAPSSGRNIALSFITDPAKTWMNDTSLQAAELPANYSMPTSDPVVFDSYMQDKLANFEPRTTAPGPRPNYQGL